jgi:hypothetical protein
VRLGTAVEIGSTIYRSVAEALWGEFLVETGADPVHEPFYVGGAAQYLPDFWLPHHRAVIEIKNGRVTTMDLAKWRAAQAAFEGSVHFAVIDGHPPGRWHLIVNGPGSIELPQTIPALTPKWVYGPWPGIEWDAEIYQRVRVRVDNAPNPIRVPNEARPEYREWSFAQ